MTQLMEPPNGVAATANADIQGEQPPPEAIPLLELMATTRAMRRLAPDPVPEPVLRRVIEAATWAPTADNAQAESFILVTDRAVMARLAPVWARSVDTYLAMAQAIGGGQPDDARLRIRDAILFQRDHFAEIPALIVACFDDSAGRRTRTSLSVSRALLRALGLRRYVQLAMASGRFATRYQAASVYPAVENLLLAARAEGLGACLTTWHVLSEAELKRELGIPRHIQIFAVIPVGWPLGRFGRVVRHPVETFIRRDGWAPDGAPRQGRATGGPTREG